MRIISGQFKGRRFSPPTDIKARPTTDFAKEGLFNLLNNRIDFEDITVLDLFAGTGSLSMEFISRYCKSATAVEHDRKQCAFIRKLAAELKVNNLILHQGDVMKFISSCHSNFDLIFADPPYSMEQLETLPDLILQAKLLKEDGLLILEHGSKQHFEEHPNFNFHRNYGNVNFSFFTA